MSVILYLIFDCVVPRARLPLPCVGYFRLHVIVLAVPLPAQACSVRRFRIGSCVAPPSILPSTSLESFRT